MPYSDPSSRSLKSYFIKSQMILSVIILSICVVGLISIATYTFKKYSEYNLQLIAQSLSEQLQAAVVFEDTQTVNEVLKAFVYKYPIESIQVLSSDAELIAEAVNTSQAAHSALIQQIQKRLIAENAGERDVIHNGQTIAKVKIVSSINPLMSFVNLFLLIFLSCIFFAFIIGWLSTRIFYRRINHSLNLLTDTTELISEKRAFQMRVPRGRITEFNKISYHFNELLKEIQTWHSHIQQENSHLEHRALHDSLTQLPNRAYFNQRLNLLFDDEDIRPNFALLFIDNNKFKEINDNYGHQVGDQVLQAMAGRLKMLLRHNDFLARLGGDEFAVLLVNAKHVTHAIIVAQNLLRTCDEPLVIDETLTVHISFSVGIAMSADANSSEELIYFADQAMYQAKSQVNALGKLSTTKSVTLAAGLVMPTSVFIKAIVIALCASILTACMGLGGLSHRQIKVLQKEGFVYTDEGWTLEMPSRLLFETDQHMLQAEQQKSIAELSQKLHAIKLDKLVIQGHTDNVGSESYNQELSQRRANSVAEITLGNGFVANNIKISGYGSHKPIASNDTETGRSENRRVSVVIVP